MKQPVPSRKNQAHTVTATSEMLLLRDGRLLVHNLTPALARLLQELSPDDPQISPRADPFPQNPPTHELPN